MKKLILINIFLALTTQNFAAKIVYDPTNHRQNMQNYQMMILQKIEEAKTATESIIQTQQQLEQLQHDLTNLEAWSGAFLGEENSALTEALNDLNTINANSKSILRNAENIEQNFEMIYATKEKLANMDGEELANEMYRLSQTREDSIKEYLKTAATILEQNQKDNAKMANFMALTDGAKGNLQASVATKKGVDHLNNKMSRMNDLEAKKLSMEAEKIAQEEAEERIESEKAKRLQKMSPESETAANSFINKKGKGW